MRILGIDPGLQCTGWAVVALDRDRPRVIEAGIIRTRRGQEPAERLREIYRGLTEVIQQLAPEVAVVESLYAHYRHPRTAILMGHARGVIFLAAAERDLSVKSYAATRIKKALTGNGRASKAQVQRTVQITLGLPSLPEPDDVADALAVALCHAHTVRSAKLP
jgi:crossover junction endodeoxyribonuclease RuvC